MNEEKEKTQLPKRKNKRKERGNKRNKEEK